MRKCMMIALGAIAATMLAVAPARADLLAPGGAETLPNATFGPISYSGGTILASYVNAAPTFSSGITGTETTAVIREAGGTLDFLYQIDANSGNKSAIHRVTVTSFGDASVTTNVQFGTAGSPFSSVTGAVMSSADRSPDGGTVGWTLSSGTSGGLTAGKESYVMIIRTNATKYVDGVTNAIDGGVIVFKSFAPDTTSIKSVPEPSTMALAGLGALGLIGYGLRRRKALGV